MLKKRNKETIRQLLDKVLPQLATHLNNNLTEIIPLFHDYKLERVVDIWTRGPEADPDEEISVENGNVQQIGLRLRLEGFTRAGAHSFDMSKDLILKLDTDKYEVAPDKYKVWLEKDYEEAWTQQELERVAEKWCNELIEEITQRLENMD
ncbi:hypothetical protein CLV24_10425 [Pontibacter ummariensis]|uniref:Uncharacterized protein n=1 Tax=Pontibacter ummariensis TaxID=1610492 RepID=A0A239D480_9BACT|nr:hypothetical protein [Pontibacter ummariensis]PRY14215.1 hypothetical protein CLV24_10425 [Pontibacter ummariensis]SNS26644.1 hypothetical protein SAMN06296052_10425 [Pontibacter ummariensis]